METVVYIVHPQTYYMVRLLNDKDGPVHWQMTLWDCEYYDFMQWHLHDNGWDRWNGYTWTKEIGVIDGYNYCIKLDAVLSRLDDIVQKFVSPSHSP